MKKLLTQLWKDENGQDLIEYALLAALIALAAVAAMNSLGHAINGVFTSIGTNLNANT